MKTIQQLFQEQLWLICALDRGRFAGNSAETNRVLRRIEEIDFAIAATPASVVEDLWIKALRLRDSLSLGLGGQHDAVLMDALVEDCARLARIPAVGRGD